MDKFGFTARVAGKVSVFAFKFLRDRRFTFRIHVRTEKFKFCKFALIWSNQGFNHFTLDAEMRTRFRHFTIRF